MQEVDVEPERAEGEGADGGATKKIPRSAPLRYIIVRERRKGAYVPKIPTSNTRQPIRERNPRLGDEIIIQRVHLEDVERREDLEDCLGLRGGEGQLCCETGEEG